MMMPVDGSELVCIGGHPTHKGPMPDSGVLLTAYLCCDEDGIANRNSSNSRDRMRGPWHHMKFLAGAMRRGHIGGLYDCYSFMPLFATGFWLAPTTKARPCTIRTTFGFRDQF